jgi:hypothetical protein
MSKSWAAPPCPAPASPDTASPDTENPYLDTPDTAEPYTEKPAQLNKDRRNKEKEIPDESITDTSNPDPIYPPAPLQGAGYDGMGYEEAREIVRENIEYDTLVQDPRQDREQRDFILLRSPRRSQARNTCFAHPSLKAAGTKKRRMTAVPAILP